ncbi:MAG: transketolase family protein [Parcubacteria group bacterium]|nr:transketolase family protein [Parcubacteria group bacterium]
MPLNPKAKLNPDLLDKAKIKMAPIRDGYGEGLVKLGEEDPRVVVLCADLTESTRSLPFKQKFPERFIQMGVAEQNMATVASGLANYGKIPFISSYAVFSPGRNYEQIRTTCALNNVPVKIAGAHAGISVGPDGATHQALDDVAIMRVMPRMTVLVPCDAIEARKATIAAGKIPGPVYIRFGREKSPLFTTDETPFDIGKAHIFWDGIAGKKLDLAIVASSQLVWNALLAASELEKEGISVRVINNPSVKPIDKEILIAAAKDAGAMVTVEEHQVAGGMGSAVAEVLAKNYSVPIEFIGVQDRFGESGEAYELIEAFGMGVKNILEAAKKVIKRK